LIFISLISDGRPVHTIGNARDALEELNQVWHRPTLLRLLLRLALAQKPPTGLRRFRRKAASVPDDGPGKQRGQLDIKHEALQPIVGIARYASLAAGVRATSTLARLRAASVGGTLEARDARTLREAYELFWRVRLDHQVEQVRDEREPDDLIDTEALDPLTRRYTRDAFHAVGAVQRTLKGQLEHPS
jgi:CBS domain-containing protein